MSRPRLPSPARSASPPPALPSRRASEKDAPASDVIRYWLATLAYQEALSARPKARRPADTVLTAINLEEPVAGQDYAKLAFAGAEAFLVQRRGEIHVDLSSEWCGFFEHWLAARYRRGEDDEGNTRQLVFFPTLHLPRDELAGLLRFPVEMEWRHGEQVFAVPGYAERKRRDWPAPPTRVRLRHPASEPEQTLPFFIDAKVLHDTLRIDSERIDDFFSELRDVGSLKAQDAVAALCALIETQNALDGNCAIASPRLLDRVSTEVDPGHKHELDRLPAHRPGCTETSSDVHRQDPDRTGRNGPATAVFGPSALLARLVRAVSKRLTVVQSRARVYGVALVVCGDQTRATWYLQKDLREALDALANGGLAKESPLRGYLTGSAPKPGQAVCWGRWRGAGLTDSQRAACELSLGSRLAAVQGPPGTGKTTLILNMLAHTLVRKVAALARGGTMGRAITVVTSTNNRAVDNVVDPLGRDLDPQYLSLSIRVGSKQVLENVTLGELDRVRRWLEEEMIPDLQARPLLKTELERFRGLHAALESRLAAEQMHQQRLERLREVEAEIDELQLALAPDGEDRDARLRSALCELAAPPPARPSGSVPLHLSPSASATSDDAAAKSAIDTFLRQASRHAAAAVELRLLAGRLEALSEIAGGHGRRALAEAKRHWKQTQKTQLSAVRRGLGFHAFPGRLPPVPEPTTVEDALEAWEEAAEAMLGTVRDAEQVLLGKQKNDQTKTKWEALQKELAALHRETAAPPPEMGPAERSELDGQHLELFECAVRVREAWASVHRADLLAAIDRAVRAIQATRSLRSLMEKQNDVVRWLRELFPAWGCTLLSLGNIFPPEQDSVELAVIDEAGQCHPAYALAALLRAESALIIGDVNQLEPVVGLGMDDEKRIVHGLELKAELEALAPFRAYDGSTTSAQALADRAVLTRPTLVDHFRCQPEIAAICEALCHYGLVAKTPKRTRAQVAPLLTAPVLHAAIDGAQERFAGSWMNDAELRATLQIVRELLASGLRPEEIGIITPYRGQLERLWRGLREIRVPLERPPIEMIDSEGSEGFEGLRASDRGLAVGTVHRFQGGERSVILFTTTVTERRSLEFVDARVNLVNVAASRARDHLITIGHSPTLMAGRHTRHLVEAAIPFVW